MKKNRIKMIVYVVVLYNYEQTNIVGVFSTKELAKKYIDSDTAKFRPAWVGQEPDNLQIEEYELDKTPDE